MALQDTDLLPLWRKADQTNRKISVADFATYLAPDASNGLPKPGKEGTFVVEENAAGDVYYSELIDCGTKDLGSGEFDYPDAIPGTPIDISDKLPEAGREGTFAIQQSAAGSIFYTELIDCGVVDLGPGEVDYLN